MSEVVINVTKVEEVVTINATPNVTQILVNTNSGGGIQSVVAGTNITIDDTDPLNPIISASGGGGAVDSVNGQTGVVVLDADDVGAEPTRGSNDNYVTDAQLVIIGNTSGTNSGDNATNTTSNAYADAKVASELASFKTTNFLDFISSGQTQLDGKSDKSDLCIKSITSDVTTTSNTLLNTNLSFPIGANEIWTVEFNIIGGCASSGGMKITINTPSGSSGSGAIIGTNNTTLSTQAIGINSISTTFGSGNSNSPQRIYLTIRNGATPGNVVFSYASNSSGQTSIIRANSYMIATKSILV